MSPPPSNILALVNQVQETLEAVYQIRAPDVRDFLVDTNGLAALGGGDLRPADEWVLVAESEDGLDLAVYIEEGRLSELGDAQDLGEAADLALPALASVVEGVSHFLLLIERARREEPVTMLELEAQAEVDKYLVPCLHHPLRAQEWHQRIFALSQLGPRLSGEERDRYREASRLGAAWCRHLSTFPHLQARLNTQRAFWRAPGMERLRRMRSLCCG